MSNKALTNNKFSDLHKGLANAKIIDDFRLRHPEADTSDIRIIGYHLDWYDTTRESIAPRTFTVILHQGFAGPAYEFSED
jgi:hypothetical protein